MPNATLRIALKCNDVNIAIFQMLCTYEMKLCKARRISSLRNIRQILHTGDGPCLSLVGLNDPRSNYPSRRFKAKMTINQRQSNDLAIETITRLRFHFVREPCECQFSRGKSWDYRAIDYRWPIISCRVSALARITSGKTTKNNLRTKRNEPASLITGSDMSDATCNATRLDPPCALCSLMQNDSVALGEIDY